MRTKIAGLALIAVTAGTFAYTRTGYTPPADLRDAMADEGFDTSIPSFEEKAGNIPEPKAAAVDGISKGYINAYVPYAGVPTVPVEWVAIPGGKFTMGTDSDAASLADARPAHEVAIKKFRMSKTAVTVEQYAECVVKGDCTVPDTGDYCNWGRPGRQIHPVNCVDWKQAQAYAKFKGARLPSEAEWEYAATSGGKNQKYPWGNDEPTSELVVYNTNGTMPVCSKPKGNTAQGLCDMSGNVAQFVQDSYQEFYYGAPVDGRAFESKLGSTRVIRGGSFVKFGTHSLRVDSRANEVTGQRSISVGFRLAK